MSASDSERFVLERRAGKEKVRSDAAYSVFTESEADGLGAVCSIGTVLITNRECPWRCIFCDLWRNTLDETVSPGSIPRQIEAALGALPGVRWIKLYNAGSFFDPHAIPQTEYPAIARLVMRYERVIVESHPVLINSHAEGMLSQFRQCLSRAAEGSPLVEVDAQHIHQVRITPHQVSADQAPELGVKATAVKSPRLEVAMGLETVHTTALERLNKGMTLGHFARAARLLRTSDIDLRVFVLVQPPFTPPEESVQWALRSLDFAREQGARLVAFIPTRGGNGAMEALAATGDFVPPRLSTLEEVLDRALENSSSHGGPLVVADLWDLERFSDCAVCFPARADRIRRMNLAQRIEPRVECCCSSG